MEVESMKIMMAVIGLAVGATAAAVSQSFIAVKAIDGMARNPKVVDKLFTNMIVAMALIESSAIYTLVIALIILFS